MTDSVFVDSWAWIAMAVADDPDHDSAHTLYRDLVMAGKRRVTSRWVIGETLTRLRYDVSHAAAVMVRDGLRDMAEAGLLEVVLVEDRLWEEAMTVFDRFDDQRFSVVDCTSFAIMQSRGITAALTADRHFAAAGFTPLGV